MFTALRATSLTLAEILRQHFNDDPTLRLLFNPAFGGNMLVSLTSPPVMSVSGAQGLSLWLYRVRRDGELLNRPPERINAFQTRRVALPVCLHYLLTPVIDTQNALAGETEQIILGKGLQVLHDHAIVRGTELQDDFSGTTHELHIRMETLPLEELSRVYDALERSYQLSVSYEVTTILIESEHEPQLSSPVEVVIPRYALRVEP